MSAPNPSLANGKIRMNPPVFYFAASFILLFGLVVIINPQAAGDWLLAAQNWAANTVGWYYMLAMTLYLVFVVVTALSGYGKIKLGADHDEPEFSYLSWAGMLFAAGISITLFFFCVSEPLTHMLQPPQGEAGTADAARQAMQILFLHWGLHGWGVFAFVGMALAYFAYRHNLPLALRSALYPLIGKRINGPIGYAVDGFGIIATVFGLGADMGFGVLHLNSGLDYLFGIAHTQWVQVGLITLMMGAAIIVAVAGVDKGVRVMSDINMLLACALLLFVLFAGPTQHLLNTLIQNLGDYLGALPMKSFDLYAYDKPSDWLGGWTVFYWAWWIAWSPFVGLFIARVSRGRSIREFILGTVLAPTLAAFVWFSVFGGTALHLQIMQGLPIAEAVSADVSTGLFAMFDHLPMGGLMSGVATVLVLVFFVTSGDSATLVLGMMSTGGNENPSARVKIVWGLLVSGIAISLLLAGGVKAVQTATIVFALPFTLVILLMALALWRGVKADWEAEDRRDRALRRRLREMAGPATPPQP